MSRTRSLSKLIGPSGSQAFDTNTLVIDAANNRVGIGTISPAQLLHLVKTDNSPQLRITGAADWDFYSYNDSSLYINNSTGTVLSLFANKNASFDGNVGIGTSSPTEGNLVVRNDSGNSKINIKVNDFAGSSYAASLDFSTGGQGANDPQAQIKAVGANNYSANLIFSTQLSGTTNPLVERMRIDASGHAIIPAGVTLGTAAGVYAAANTLDDYEEGTWTPAMTSSGTVGTWTPSYNTAFYTKIGNLVHVSILVGGTYTSGSGTMMMTGFPFTAGGSGLTLSVNEYRFINTGSYTTVKGMEMSSGSAIGYLYMTGSINNEATVQTSNWGQGGTTIVWASGSYRTNQ